MEKLARPGQIIFAIGITALGVISILSKDFVFGRPPLQQWQTWIPWNVQWTYISATIMIVCGLAVLFNYRARAASIIAGIMILVFSFILRHLYEMTDWINAYKSLALAGGAFIIAGSFAYPTSFGSGTRANEKLIFTGCLFFSLFFIICGLSHFKFYGFINKDFMPAYIPFPGFWTYFCGICLLAAGIGIVIPRINRWAALLSAIMIGGWFVLLHTVRFYADITNTSDQLGFFESFTFTGMLLVLAATLSKNMNQKFRSDAT